MSDAQRTPGVAVIDDGELDDVCELLEDFGLEFTRIGKGRRVEGPSPARKLLVAGAARATALRLQRTGSRSDADRAIWIAVIQPEALVKPRRLLQAGFDYVVRRPVHPAALRHLLTEALFADTDRRRGRRLAVGYEVGLRAGFWRHKVTLVDLSGRGCRVLAPRRISDGKGVIVQIPAELCGGDGISVRGTVLRSRRAEPEGGEPDEASISIRFAPFDTRTKKRLRDLLVRLLTGPASLRISRGETARRKPGADPESGSKTRRFPRGVFEEQVVLFGDQDRVVVGSDLSREGMRIRPCRELAVGDTVRLAIEAGGRFEPVVVNAKVIRDDGELGLALRFAWVEPKGRDRIDQIVSALPAVEINLPEAELDDGDETLTVTRLVPTLLRLSPTGEEIGAASKAIVSKLLGREEEQEEDEED